MGITMKNITKIKLLFITIFFLLISFQISAQASDTCYTVVKETDHIWRIIENNYVNIYLVEGKDSALVIDTGEGAGDLKSYIKTLTDLPLIVMNTHGHPDHVGADQQFGEVYLNPEDFYMVKNKFDGQVNFIPLNEGYVFDLGGIKLEVIEVPGHTHGSVVLLDEENKVLFSGDNTNNLVWLFLKDCYPLSVYLKTLEKVQTYVENFNIIMPGHNEPLPKTFVSEQIGCVKTILDGTCEPVPYNKNSFTKGSMLCTYKTAQVAYDPNKLFE